MKSKYESLYMIVFLLFSFITLHAQTLPVMYGLTKWGGAHNNGTIIKYYPGIDTTTMDVFDFDSTRSAAGPGGLPMGNLILADDGNLYGLTFAGGANGMGTIFQYNIITSTFTKKIDLSDSTGTMPKGSLFQASDGNLYAPMATGGHYNMGTLIKYDYHTNQITKLYDFRGYPDGSNPTSSFIEYNGVLYSTTYSGGSHNYGTLFHYDLITGTVSIDVNFDNLIYGRYPNGAPMQASNGFIYGMAPYNSPNADNGVLYRFDPIADTCVPLYYFPGTNHVGIYPMGSLLQAHNGLLYGLASLNTDIFHYDIATDSMYNDYQFTLHTEGNAPFGTLIQASDSLLYGICYLGGTNNQGTIFSLNTANDQFAVLVQLSYGTGFGAYGSLVQTGTISLGINQVNNTRLIAYPNPSNSQINVTGLNFRGGENVQVCDLNGHVLSVNATILPDRAVLDIHSLEAGMYMVIVKQQGTTYTSKFVKVN